MKVTLPVKVVAHEFIEADFIGGHPVLDFINTVTGRDEQPCDWLDNYSRLIIWSKKVDILPVEMLSDLMQKTKNNELAAEQALEQVKELREELFLLFHSLITKQDVDKNLLKKLTKRWRVSCSSHDLVAVEGKIKVSPDINEPEFQIIEKRLTYLAIKLAGEFPSGRLRICKGKNCAWLYLDSSKAGRRCWCDMKTCGNTSKVRRFMEKKKSSDNNHEL